jgi:spermidine synthase
MTAGVFRHGQLSGSRDAKVLFARDGKTATVHLVEYTEATSIRTNGKPDGSVNMKEGERGSDEITMALTAAVPLALKPDAKTAAVIGIGTGVTTHTLLQSLALERVETIEIESAMAEASRGFIPRNSAAFADPRSRILIDDAKTFFSTRNRRYDLVISEPSNPWVSGVSSLFTREFYRRIRGHLNPGGLLVQWFQLYEIDTSLAASVLAALGGTFSNYAVFAPSDHDLLIVAGDKPVALPLTAEAFERHPGLARELFTVHILSAGDLNARYIGSRATLEPLFLTYGMPPNSDYAPILDLNAARYRFTERSAVDVVALINLPVPVLEMLEPRPGSGRINPVFEGAQDFERVENARVARQIHDYLISNDPDPTVRASAQLQKDLEIVKLRLLDCRDPRNQDVWLHALLRLAQNLNPGVSVDEAGEVWQRIAAAPCYAGLAGYQRQWIELFAAVGARDPRKMAELGTEILAGPFEINRESREYAWMAGLTGLLVRGDRAAAKKLWALHADEMRASAPKAAFRLLRCHAETGSAVTRAAACAAVFSRYARS